jgi:hypothetical protein
VIRPERCLLTEGVDARDRFEGEYPHVTWHHGRAVEAHESGYAPSKHPTKRWPPEALLEVWCSLCREARDRFDFAQIAEANLGEHTAMWTHAPPATRNRRPTTAVALNANETPGVNGEDAPGMDGYALDAAFPGSDLGWVPRVTVR